MPVGTVFTEEETAALVAAAQENDAWIVFNGHADKVAFGGRTVHNPATFAGMRDRTLVVGCMSKNYLMPGWRIGWAAGPRAVMGAMEDVHIFNGDHAERDHPGRGGRGARRPAGLAGRGGARPTPAGRQRCCEAALASPRLSAIAAEGGYYCLLDTTATGVPRNGVRRPAARRGATWPSRRCRAGGADDFGEHLVRLIFTNEPEDRLREAGRRIAAFADAA